MESKLLTPLGFLCVLLWQADGATHSQENNSVIFISD